jgi:hypothetical protein
MKRTCPQNRYRRTTLISSVARAQEGKGVPLLNDYALTQEPDRIASRTAQIVR